MRKVIYFFYSILGLWFPFHLVYAETPTLPTPQFQTNTNAVLDSLVRMVHAHKNADYELYYILQRSNGAEVDSLRFRHAVNEGKQYAQLLELDNSKVEIIQRDQTVSYFGSDFQPFSLSSAYIVDSLPSVFFANFNELAAHYNFIDVGKSRVADRVARVIRIVPKDDFRYQYTVWIDEQNNLLLQSHLTDRDGRLLEMFRVIHQYMNEQIKSIIEPIDLLILPTLLSQQKESGSTKVSWKANWLPAGFSVLNSAKQSFSDVPISSDLTESQLFSDGLFSFTVYVSPNKGVSFNEQFWQQGGTTIYSHTLGNNDVFVVGDIPMISAKQVVQNLQFAGETSQ